MRKGMKGSFYRKGVRPEEIRRIHENDERVREAYAERLGLNFDQFVEPVAVPAIASTDVVIEKKEKRRAPPPPTLPCR